MSAEAKAVISPFGSGSRVCIGIHVAYMEMRLAAARFFRECRGVALAPETTPDSMAFVNYFGIFPKSQQCNIVLRSGR